MLQPDPVEPAISISARPLSLRRLRGDRRAQYALVCCLSAVSVMAYFVATRVVSPDGTGGTVLGELVYPQAEALAGLGLL